MYGPYNKLLCKSYTDGKAASPCIANRISRNTWAENVLKGDMLREREYRMKHLRYREHYHSQTYINDLLKIYFGGPKR